MSLEFPEGVSVTKTLITPKETLQKGSTIGARYTIIEELGRGGMGVVYKAEDTKLKRTSRDFQSAERYRKLIR